MAVYPVGSPHFEYRGGDLVQVQTLFDDSNGTTTEDVQPADEAAAGNEGAAGGAFTGPSGVIPSDFPQTEGQLPANDPIYPSAGGRLGDLTGNVGQNANYGAAGSRMQQYGMSPQANAASQTYGNQGGSNMPGGNSLTPEQRQAMGLPGGGIGGAPVATGAPGMGGAGGAAPNTGVAGDGRPDADFMRGLDLYNPENPMVAVENVIQDMGLGRGFGNPMVSFIKKMAQGLALSYIAQNAQTPGVTGDSAANAPYAFRDYLNNAIGGGGGRGMGHGMSAMLGTARNLPALVEIARGVDQNKSGNIQTVNPFAEMLTTLLGANTGQGTASFLSNLLGPSMPRGLGEAYESGLNARTRLGQRAYYGKEGGPMAEGDIWTQLLGSR